MNPVDDELRDAAELVKFLYHLTATSGVVGGTESNKDNCCKTVW